MSEPITRCFAFAHGLGLAVTGPGWLVAQFALEYAGAETGHGPADVEITLAGRTPAHPAIRDRYKSVSWAVSLSDPDAAPLRAEIALGGRPRSFARSLVQGYFVEPLLSLAAARRGMVLLPAAALELDGEALVVMGRSRSGKSTLVARAAARGTATLGDDQVIVGPGARCSSFPRRTRLYPDLRRTAPGAYRGLPRGSRAALLARAVVRRLSGGYVAPSLAVQLRMRAAATLPIGRAVLIEREGTADAVESAPLARDDAVEAALAILAEQRGRLARAPGWEEAAAAAADKERGLLRDALAEVPVERIRIPDRWPAEDAVPALARALGVES